MKTYLSISITYYGGKYPIAPTVHYFRAKGDYHISTQDKLTVDEANRMMWELVRIGGKNTYESNSYDSAICTRKVTFWGRL